jgi:hypothetical protein
MERRMAQKVMDRDALTGTETIFHSHSNSDEYAVESRQDVSEIITGAKELRKNTSRKTPYGDGLTRVASIPMVMYADWVKKGYTKDQKKMKQLLNSPDLRYFRTREGKV